MAILFRPTRNEVSRSFPVLGFTVRTGQRGSTYEVALATDPGLLGAAGRSARTPKNFWSSHQRGPLAAPLGESVFLVPPEVLARFAGQERLYYAIAVFEGGDRSRVHLVLPPEAAAPYVTLSKSFDGRVRRLGTGGRDGERTEYGTTAAPESLTWAADQAQPGSMEPVAAGISAGSARQGEAAHPSNGSASPGQAASQQQAYSDGLGDRFWEELEAEIDAGDDREVGSVPEEGDGAEVEGRAGPDAPPPDDPISDRFVPAATSNYRVGNGRTVDKIVVHITDGGSRTSGTIAWFQNPAAKVSAHYVIGQDGEVVQMVRHADVAWHAGPANATSIGIEHVANTRGLTPSSQQYAASARLVRWLCDHFRLPVDGAHVLGHAEADPHTTHRGCPDAAWDWSHYRGLLTAPEGPVGSASDAQLDTAPHRTAQTLEGPMDLYYDDCYLVPQPTGMSCWAASATMVYSWMRQMSFDPTVLAQECARIDQLSSGLPADQRAKVAEQLGLTFVWPQSYSLQGFYDLLANNGPLYVGVAVPSGHAVCVVGLHGDGSPEGTTVIYHDPWPPNVGAANQRKNYVDFMTEYENRASGDANTPAFPQILHGNGRRRSAAQALGLAPFRAASTYRPQTNGHGGSGGTATLVRAAEGPAVAVGGAVAGAISGAVLGNSGDVSWSLGQLTAPHHPGGNPAKAGRGPYRRSGPIQIRGPRGSTFAGADEIYADFEVSWEQNGRSIGSVTVSPAPGGSNDAAGAALDVRAVVTPMMTELPGPASNPSATMAGVTVQFQFTFTYSWASNVTALIDLELHGDGTFSQTNRW